MASYVQQGSVSSVAGGIASTPSITGVTAGNTLVCVLSMYSSSNPTATAPTDSSGQTWSILAQSAYQNPKKVAIFYLFNAAAGTHSLSMPSTTGPQVAQVVEYKGLLAVGGTAVAAGSSSFTTSQSSGNYTPSQANEVVIAVCGVDSITNPETLSDPPTGWTSLGAQQNGATYSPAEFCYRETSSTTPVSATWSWTTAGASAIVVAGLKYYNSPIINTQPVQQSVASGSTATFSVSATTSGGALSYQWQKLTSVVVNPNLNAAAQNFLNQASPSFSISNVTSGNTVFALVAFQDSVVAAGVSAATPSTGWALDSSSASTASSPGEAIYRYDNAPSGAVSLILTFSSGTSPYTGNTLLFETQPVSLDLTPTITDAAASSIGGPASGTPTNAYELAISHVMAKGAGSIGTPTTPPGFVSIVSYNAGANGAASLASYLVLNNTATANPSSSSTSATSMRSAMTTYKAKGTDIGGATSSSYTTPTLSNADNGNKYSVAVTDSNGTTSSVFAYAFIIGESSGDGDKINSAWFTR